MICPKCKSSRFVAEGEMHWCKFCGFKKLVKLTEDEARALARIGDAVTESAADKLKLSWCEACSSHHDAWMRCRGAINVFRR